MDELYAAGAMALHSGGIPQYAAGAQGGVNMVGSGPNIVGALPQYAAGYRAGAAAAVAQLQNAPSLGNRIANGSHIGVQNQAPQDARLWPIPCSQSSVAAATSAGITARPQVHFRPQRLVVSAAVAANFVITQITCGQQNQFAQAGDLDPSSFSPDAVGTMFTFDTVEKGTDLTVSVRNTDANNAHAFLSTFWGAIVK